MLSPGDHYTGIPLSFRAAKTSRNDMGQWPQMLIVATVLVFILFGREISFLLWRDGLPPVERACYAAVLGISSWLGSLWAIALLHVMTPPVLLTRTAAAGAVVAVLWFRRGFKRVNLQTSFSVPVVAALAFGVLPLALWCEFLFWRGWILPPASHDALSYHLPKAVFWARAHGFEYLEFLDARMRNIPASYELLLAEWIVLEGTDTTTEWLSVLFYLGWVVAAAALARRWWTGGWWTSLATAIVTAGVPVALLHSGAHKNDLMTAFFIVAGLVAGGRWIAAEDKRALALCIVTFAAAVGTKPQAAAVALCLAPFLIRGLTLRLAALAAAAFLLLGGAVYISNFVNQRSAIGVGSDVESSVVAYGDWPNLWQAPYVLLAAPFSPSANSLRVPWEETAWFWRRYEIFFSHLGIPFAICAVAAPFAALKWRGRERLSISAAALAAFLLMLPVKFAPHGLYAISLPRYALFIVPIVIAWTVGAVAARSMRHAFMLIVAGGVVFSWYAIDSARNDTFSPLRYVLWVRQRPGSRVVRFDPFRAASVADRAAGPNDRIAIDAEFGTWIQPAFGANLTRPVQMLRPGTPIADDVRFVVIDRAWNMIWRHPDFTDLSQSRRYLTRGNPRADDLRVLNALRADRRFRLVFYNPKANQAVFQRVQ
jgi:hypothetical protein